MRIALFGSGWIMDFHARGVLEHPGGELVAAANWREASLRSLAERHGIAGPVPIGLSVKVAAALDCMGLAVARWVAVDGEADLVDLLREGFAALSGQDTGTGR